MRISVSNLDIGVLGALPEETKREAMNKVWSYVFSQYVAPPVSPHIAGICFEFCFLSPTHVPPYATPHFPHISSDEQKKPKKNIFLSFPKCLAPIFPMSHRHFICFLGWRARRRVDRAKVRHGPRDGTPPLTPPFRSGGTMGTSSGCRRSSTSSRRSTATPSPAAPSGSATCTTTRASCASGGRARCPRWA